MSVVSKLGIKRQSGYLYFLRGTDVYKTPMKRAGGPSAAGKAEKVAAGHFHRENGYLYYLDSNGDISRAKRAVGGQKRKKPAVKKAVKKVVKKAVAKKAVAKKAPAKKAVAKKAVAKKAPAKKAVAKKAVAKKSGKR